MNRVLFAVAVLLPATCVCVGFAVGNSKPCGSDHVCQVDEYCREADDVCTPCNDKCDETNPNFNKELCEDKCRDYIQKFHVSNARMIMWISITAAFTVVVVVITGALFLLLRWKKMATQEGNKTDSSNTLPSGGPQTGAKEENGSIATMDTDCKSSDYDVTLAPPFIIYDPKTANGRTNNDKEMQMHEMTVEIENLKNQSRSVSKKTREPSESELPGSFVYGEPFPPPFRVPTMVQ